MKCSFARRAAVIMLTVFLLPLYPAGYSGELSTSAASAILMDAETGTVLYESNADKQRLIASTTKIMTALVALEQTSDLDESFEVPEAALYIEGSSMYLKAGQIVTVRDLLNGLMLLSGNDAAAALAIHCCGSVEAFADRMNQKAAALGMKNTRFCNPHGLNAENHYSTARDMAILTREALRNETFSHIVSSKFARIGGISVKNHNRMLWSYQGADGVKTGYTIDAGRCLVSSATRDGVRLIAVTLDDRDDWNDHAAMLDYGFSNYTLRTVCLQGEEISRIPILGEAGGILPVTAAQTLRILLPRDKAEQLEVSIFLPRYLWAPTVLGQRAGMITVTLDGKLTARCPLILGYAIKTISEQLTGRLDVSY